LNSHDLLIVSLKLRNVIFSVVFALLCVAVLLKQLVWSVSFEAS